MDLKQRKAIQNGVLPRFDLGLSKLPDVNPNSLNAGMMKSGQFVMNKDGKLEPDMLKGKAGQSFNNFSGLANTAMSAINFVDTIGGLSKNTMTSDEMMGSGGASQESANGVGYTQQRVDDAGIQKQIDATAAAAVTSGLTSGATLGSTAGSLFGPLGTAIGGVAGAFLGGALGVFGGNKAKREAERQKQIAINRTIAANTQNREQAYTIGLRNEFNRENVTDESQSLFHAALGIEDIEKDVDPRKMRTKHKHLVDTAEHGIVPGFGNSFGSEGETMISGKADKNGMHKVHRIRRGPNDTALMNLKKHDTVGSRRFMDYETGLPIADAISLNAQAHGGKISTEDKQRYEMNQDVERMMKYTGRRKGNVLPGYIGGTIGNVWNKVKSGFQNLDISGMLPLINAYNIAAQRDARAKGIHRANSQSLATNPYGNAAVERLSGLKQDYYPVFSKNRETEARIWNGIRNSGGLSAGQSALFGALLSNQTQQNNADAIFNSQTANNQLASQAEKAKIALGDSNATRSMQGYQWDTDYFAKGHAANENKLETSAYDKQNALNSYLANLFKKYQFGQTMGLYRDQQKIDYGKLQKIINSLG